MAVISEDANPAALQLADANPAVAHQADASPGASHQEVSHSAVAIPVAPNVAVDCQHLVG
jgi:hypothetical protein